MMVSTLGSAIGWWLGNFFGLPAALLLSTIGGIFGVYYGWKWNREIFG